MKMKMKVLAAAVGLVIAGGANASVDYFSTGNGELWLSVRDNTSQQSISIGLSRNIDGSTAGSTAFDGTTSQTFNLGAVQSFVTTGAGHSFSWMVGAGDSTTPGTANGLRYMSTTTASGISGLNNQTMGGMGIMDTDLLANLNSFPPKDGVVVGSTDVAYFLDSMDNWQGNANFVATSSLDTAMNFFMLSNSASTATFTGKTKLVNVATFEGTWKLDGTGSLQYTVASVPAVPVPAAVWLLGSALVGMVGVARRKVSAV